MSDKQFAIFIKEKGTYKKVPTHERFDDLLHLVQYINNTEFNFEIVDVYVSVIYLYKQYTLAQKREKEKAILKHLKQKLYKYDAFWKNGSIALKRK